MIGLSAAWRLASEGVAVTVLERGEPGREASWAGAGILNPGDPAHAATPFDRLMALSSRLHAEWAGLLRELTGIDNGYRRCGAMSIALRPEDRREIDAEAEHRRAERIECRRLSGDEARRLEPGLGPEVIAAWHYPAAAQVRNPWHLRAVAAAALRAGVTVRSGCPALRLLTDGPRVTGVLTPEGPVSADAVLVAAGPWSGHLLADAGVPTVRTRPVRGQIVLLNSPRPLLSTIVERGPMYVVPRPDGRLLIGSTEEDAGFRKANTPEAVAGLLDFARRVVPASAGADFERAWSGLRPGNADGRPYIGAVATHPGLYVAAGHLRNGLQLSTGTAELITALILGRTPPVAEDAFRPDRPEGVSRHES